MEHFIEILISKFLSIHNLIVELSFGNRLIGNASSSDRLSKSDRLLIHLRI